MTDKRESIGDNELDTIVGGLYTWHTQSLVLDYDHADGTTTHHKINDLQKGWELSNQMHGQFADEDTILQELINKGYIDP